MILHEYQSKALLKDYHVLVPEGILIESIEQTNEIIHRLMADSWIVKAQIHAFGKKQAGGIKKAHSATELTQVITAMLGSRLVTPATGPMGQPVNSILVEKYIATNQAYYMRFAVDFEKDRIECLATSYQAHFPFGHDLREVSEQENATLSRVYADPVAGFQPYHGRRLAFALGLKSGQIPYFTDLFLNIYQLFKKQDVFWLEINSLLLTQDDTFVVADVKIVLDDHASYRHAERSSWRDIRQVDPNVLQATKRGFKYIGMRGNIACLVNGTGLAVATADLLRWYGGEPANILDIDGKINVNQVTEAVRFIASYQTTHVLFINIFGGIVSCVDIAKGILSAIGVSDMTLPIVVRLVGNKAIAAREMIVHKHLKNVTVIEDLEAAAHRVVDMARGKQ